ncbi:hypothetical protein CCO03_16405 [Comamonas serinivorans]|uniref:Uncharacterized protein n=1 Tax=Comamonas serinivorans TaxID=1082851 RepID=A0A1Y0ERA8_9BURK|nr:DUF11 domain-containing protein [Comamonas serinivorans]ARU06038.1 hypothetical protein CCO03_16405 [Comamonas serinivorans]
MPLSAPSSALSSRQRLSSLSRLAGLTVVLATASTNVWAQSCDGTLFISQNTPTTLLHSAFPVNFQAVGSAAPMTYNALGHHTNGDLYGLQTSSNTLLRINQTTGVVTTVGAVAGLPVASYNAGTIGTNNLYYVKPVGNTNTLYTIDPTAATPTATATTLSQSITISDMGWVSGLLYASADDGQLYAIDPATGTVTAIGAPDNTGGVLGAQFSGPNGLFGVANSGAGFFQISLTTGARTLLSGAPASGNNDGASCPTANVLTSAQADLGVTKTDGATTYTPGTPVVYTIVASNAGPSDADGVALSDPLPAGITNASWTCTATGAATCTNAGTGALTDTINLPNGTSATYTVTLQVPADFTGNLVNTVQVTPPAGVTDPNPNNNSATDTNTPASVPPGPAPTPVPTDSPWMLLGLAAALGGYAARAKRRARA